MPSLRGQAGDRRFPTSPRPRSVSAATAFAITPLPQPELRAAIPRLRRYACALTRDATRADDLVQETLARAWEKRQLWKAGSDLRAWLFTVMHNVYVNQVAAAMREAPSVPFDPSADGDEALLAAVPGEPADRLELQEVARQIQRLPPDQREVLLLAVFDELHYREIAAVLAIPVGTVMSRLSRARQRLRQAILPPPAED